MYCLYVVSCDKLQLFSIECSRTYGLCFEIRSFKKINSVAVLLLTIPLGIKAMCAGIAVSLLFNVFVGMFFTSKVISLSMREQWKELLPVLTISVSMGIFIYGVGLLIDNAYAKVAIEIPIAVLFVLAGLFIFKFRESIILVNYSKK